MFAYIKPYPGEPALLRSSHVSAMCTQFGNGVVQLVYVVEKSKSVGCDPFTLVDSARNSDHLFEIDFISFKFWLFWLFSEDSQN
jgi:hypothetical protein